MEKEIKIENREVEIGDGKPNFKMVDLIIDGTKIDTGSNPVSSISFWQDMEQITQRAIFRIKSGNPKMNFDFNLSTMGMSEEAKNERFTAHLESKYPNIDVRSLMTIIESEISSIQVTGVDDNHPNPYMKVPIDSQLTKNVIVSVLDKFLESKK